MKQRIILLFIALFAISASGALVATLHIKKSSDELTHLIKLHEVEDLRKNLVIRVQAVQADLYTIRTPLAQNLDALVDHVINLEQNARNCRNCHHSAQMDNRLEDLEHLITEYKMALSHYISSSADKNQMHQLKLRAAEIGNQLQATAETMSMEASAKLVLMTQAAVSNIKKVKTILFISLLSTVILGILIAASIIRFVTRPVKELLTATNRIAAGELGYQTSYWDQTEFGLLASNFNAMSLRLQRGYETLNKKIEEKEKTEKSLMKSESFLNTIFDSIQEPLYIIDRNYIIVRMNDFYVGSLQKAVDTVIGHRCYKTLKKRDTICNNCQAEKTFSSGDTSVMEQVEQTADGHEIWSERHAYPIYDQRGTISYIIQYVRDITSRKINEKSLQHDKTELEGSVIERTKDLIAANEKLLEEIYERKEMEVKLTEAAHEWRTTFDSTNDMILLLDRDFTIVKANAATTLFLEKPFGVFVRKHMYALFPHMDSPSEANLLEQMKRSKKHAEAELHFTEKDIWVLASADPVLDPAENIIGSVVIMRDITEHKALQSQLMQVQKMDSIGRLAGGVAHDFNNVLSSIIGFTDLSLMKLPENSPLREHLDIVRESGYKAAELTRQLLAFSRKQVLKIEVINLCTLIQNMAKMLGRIIREDIKLELQMAAPAIHIMADPVQIEQVLLNMVINARDAMPVGGTMTITATDIDLDSIALGKHEHIIPGPYVQLSVRDTGVGMTRDLQERIFDPFFTTKEIGRGTGLGLSTVYGIVKQHSGHISVYSEPGMGTIFKIYLPAAEKEMKKEKQQEKKSLPAGTETILVVDDDPSIRQLIYSILEPLGYHYLEASSSREALQIVAMHETPIDLLLTDMVMPETGGRELAADVCSRCPETRVIFMSGYSDDALAHHGVLDEGVELMEKPIIPHKLAGKLREVLDRKQ
ncbi:MAG: PAS domain-containing protein [Nitrospiraceae bacterium]|nr:MAG: PAS domain-containing protein [Nitrospiraceae bacterium]